MAKAPVSDQIMAPDKMKPMLALSKREPVQVAIALTADADALMLMDKKAKPRAVMNMLKAAASKAKIQLNNTSVRFGRAEVDPEYDPGTVRLFINKDANSLVRVKLTELMKRAAYQKVEINVDAALEQEGDDAASPRQTTEPTAQVPDLAASHDTLVALIQRMQDTHGANPGHMATLAKIAALAKTKLEAKDAEGAAVAIVALKQAVDADPPPTAPDPANGAVVRLAKGLLLWNNTRSYVKTELKKLEAEIVAQSVGEADANAIKQNVGNISDQILDKLDDRLTDQLNALRGATDPAEKRKITASARQVVADYQRFIAEDDLMKDVDDNGILTLSIGPRLTTVLDAVLQVI
jgi:hypothetical protein